MEEREGGQGGRETTPVRRFGGQGRGGCKGGERRDGTDGERTSLSLSAACVCARAHACVWVSCVLCCVCKCVHARTRVCKCARIQLVWPRVFVSDPYACAWACCADHEDTRGVWYAYARAYVCESRFSILERIYESVPFVCYKLERAYTCVHPCVRMRVSARVGDDALQTWVKSRGGREFLCASRPVPRPPPPVSSVHSAATLLPPLRHPSSSLLPPSSLSRPAYNHGAVSRVVAGGRGGRVERAMHREE